MKKIALLLKTRKHPHANHVDHAVVFHVEKDKVVGVENASLEPKEDMTAFTAWMQAKKVKEIYSPYADERLRSFFGGVGIAFKAYEELSDNPLFQTFIFH
ncbi:MAG: hypothetical protein LBD89_06245 [Tannerellaceae bacterium]|nr:hypothetical protein [Tannerellaceae bacterium]